MNPEHKRIVELAAGWEGSAATVTVSPADATLLASVGCPTTPGKRQGDPAAVAAPDLCAATRKLAAAYHATPEGAKPTPNTQSVTGPGIDPDPNGATDLDGEDDADRTDLEPAAPAQPENLDALTVAELKTRADAAGVDIRGLSKKADLVAAIRAATVRAIGPDPTE